MKSEDFTIFIPYSTEIKPYSALTGASGWKSPRMKSEDLPIFRSLRMISVIHFIWVAVQCRINHLRSREGGRGEGWLCNHLHSVEQGGGRDGTTTIYA